MQIRPTDGIQHRNRIQFETREDGRKIFREYSIHEWDQKGYDLREHIRDIDEAIKRAGELGYTNDAEMLEGFRGRDN